MTEIAVLTEEEERALTCAADILESRIASTPQISNKTFRRCVEIARKLEARVFRTEEALRNERAAENTMRLVAHHEGFKEGRAYAVRALRVSADIGGWDEDVTPETALRDVATDIERGDVEEEESVDLVANINEQLKKNLAEAESERAKAVDECITAEAVYEKAKARRDQLSTLCQRLRSAVSE